MIQGQEQRRGDTDKNRGTELGRGTRIETWTETDGVTATGAWRVGQEKNDSDCDRWTWTCRRTETVT